MDAFLAGVANVDLFVGDELFATAKTLTDSTFSFDVSLEDIRGGQGAKLYGKYAHSSTMDVTLTDVMFRLEFIAKNIGSDIAIGGSALTVEEVTVTDAGQITVAGTPVAFGNFGTIGWYKKPNDSTWVKGIFNNKIITVAGAMSGDVYCVKYVINNDSMRVLTVGANFIPATVHAVMTGTLFAGSSTNPNEASTTKVGEVQIDIPRLMLNGSQEISMSMTGAANTPLNGSALTSAEISSCSDEAIYGTIKEILSTAQWENDAYALALTPADIDLKVAEKETIKVYALIRNALPKLVDPTAVTFTSGAVGTAKVEDATGEVKGVAIGKTTIHAVLTKNQAVEGYANVTVS